MSGGLSSVDGRVVISETEHFTVERYASRDEWLRARRTGVGGSDAPALWDFGFSRPWSLWAEKRGLLAPADDEADYLRIGARMEPVIADEYAYQTGRRLVDPGRTVLLRSRRWPWMIVSLDRVAYAPHETAGPGVLECKNRNVGAWGDWNEGIPGAVQVQVQHALAVTGWSWASAATIVGGSRFRFYDITPIPDFIEEHVAECRAFMRLVETGEEPEATGHESDGRALRLLYPGDSGEEIPLDDEAVRQAEVLAAAKRERKAAEEREEAAENWFRQRMGAATFGRLPDGRIAQLRTEPRRAETCVGCGAEVRRATTPRPLRFKRGE